MKKLFRYTPLSFCNTAFSNYIKTLRACKKEVSYINKGVIHIDGDINKNKVKPCTYIIDEL